MLIQIILFIAIITIPAIAQAFITISYKKYSEVQNGEKLSGFEVARKILDANNLKDMDIVSTPGTLTDHYDPSRKVVRLSTDNFNDDSVAAMAVAAHECGHAIQDKEGYFLLRLRSIIFPIVRIGTGLSYIIIVVGCLLQFAGLIYAGIAFTGLGLLFQLVTLPVEINASKRAGEQLRKLGLVNTSDASGVKSVLVAAASTYLAGVLSSALQVLRIIIALNRRN
jgi:Zn-dependent membrane protease YugP